VTKGGHVSRRRSSVHGRNLLYGSFNVAANQLIVSTP